MDVASLADSVARLVKHCHEKVSPYLAFLLSIESEIIPQSTHESIVTPSIIHCKKRSFT